MLVQPEIVGMQSKLPGGMKFYEIQNTWLFEVRDAEGKIKPGTVACYLVKKVGKKYYRWCIMFDDPKEDKIKKILKAAKKFQYKLKHGIATEVNMDGGSFGLEKDN